MGFITDSLGLGEHSWLQPAAVGALLLISLISSLLFNKLIHPIIMKVARRTPGDLGSILIGAVKLPISLGILLIGTYISLNVPLNLSDQSQMVVDLVARLLGILLGITATSSIVAGTFDWYMANIASKTASKLDDQLFPLARRITTVLVYGLGGLLILDQLNINISPLIAGLGIGGLAVALAIQPTLSNLFAGTYVMTEGVLSIGDFIELENGISGYVIDVGWRSTRIRTFQNNLVVVPNSRFAETIFTNYQRPVPAVNVVVQCGISYSSDLYEVERVCNEVMAEVLEESTKANKEFGGYFGYDSFGDSNVNFWLFVQATDRGASFGLKNALMQRLHQRFNEMGIIINYPVRTLEFPEGWLPNTAPTSLPNIDASTHPHADNSETT